MMTMIDYTLAEKLEARQIITEANMLVHFMHPNQSGDYPNKRQEYEELISKAERVLKNVYGSHHPIFYDLRENTNFNLNLALGRLGLGDEPMIDWGELTDGENQRVNQLNDMIESYVRQMHPESAWQQERLIDLIQDGEIQVELVARGD